MFFATDLENAATIMMYCSLLMTVIVFPFGAWFLYINLKFRSMEASHLKAAYYLNKLHGKTSLLNFLFILSMSTILIWMMLVWPFIAPNFTDKTNFGNPEIITFYGIIHKGNERLWIVSIALGLMSVKFAQLLWVIIDTLKRGPISVHRGGSWSAHTPQ
jgi:hypothetical protein